MPNLAGFFGWRVRRADRVKVVVDEREQLLAGGMGLLQIRQKAVLALLLRLLQEQLGVADDLIQRRAQIVDQGRRERVRGWKRGVGHDAGSPVEAIALPLKSASILPSRRASSTGLVS